MKEKQLFTSESVTEGHPDKIADQISDAILDSALAGDNQSRVACETLITTGLVLVAGEITTNTYIPVNEIVREVIKEVGYDHSDKKFDATTCGILVTLNTQSPDIAMGVNTGGAGDQGLMFGYATDETSELMPAPIFYAHQLTQELSKARKSGRLPWLLPDGKSQVTVEYEGDKILRIDTVVLSSQHTKEIKTSELRKIIEEKIIREVLPENFIDDETKIHINPTGQFLVGGPMGDTGLTGRKIIVDTYGGVGRHGGGAFSGKDPTKVDRSAAYMARYIAKNVVAAGLAHRCEIQLAYAIGVAEPVSIRVDTFGTGIVPDNLIVKAIRDIFSCTPQAIISTLNLQNPIYRSTVNYGHFGRKGFSWEETDRVKELQKII